MKVQGSIIASEIIEDYKREQYYKNKKKNKKKEQEEEMTNEHCKNKY